MLVVYLSLIPEPPDLTTPINHGDKLGHLLAYLWLAAWHTLLYPQQPKSQASVAIALILLGVVLETLQGVGGVRLFEWGDMAANSCGVILGWYGSTRLLRAEADR